MNTNFLIRIQPFPFRYFATWGAKHRKNLNQGLWVFQFVFVALDLFPVLSMFFWMAAGKNGYKRAVVDDELFAGHSRIKPAVKLIGSISIVVRLCIDAAVQ